MNPTQPKRILVVEDVRAISMRIAHVLKAHGYEVDVVKDGEECLERVATHQPDLMILDLMMPKLNGVEVLKTLRAKPETELLPVIVCT
jgi:CheY-like chemotaxis protein